MSHPLSHRHDPGYERPERYLATALLICCLALSGLIGSSHAAEMPLREVVEILFKAESGSRPDFSGKDLSFLDLSDLDFKGARLIGANLLGANLSGANLALADLRNAKLDRADVAHANFKGSILSGASLYDVVGSLSFDAPAASAPNFEGADLSRARIMARLSRTNLRGANLTESRLGPPARGNELKTPKQTDLSGAILIGARLRRADLSRTNLVFADLTNADLAEADFGGADLSRAVLIGANVAGANFDDTDLNGAVLTGLKGLETVRGWDTARNRDKAVF